jgi:hypothetical protein
LHTVRTIATWLHAAHQRLHDLQQLLVLVDVELRYAIFDERKCSSCPALAQARD